MMIPRTTTNGKNGRAYSGYIDKCASCGKEIYIRPSQLTRGLRIYCRTCATKSVNSFKMGWCPRCRGHLHKGWNNTMECLQCGMEWIDTKDYEEGLFILSVKQLLALTHKLHTMRHSVKHKAREPYMIRTIREELGAK